MAKPSRADEELLESLTKKVEKLESELLIKDPREAKGEMPDDAGSGRGFRPSPFDNDFLDVQERQKKTCQPKLYKPVSGSRPSQCSLKTCNKSGLVVRAVISMTLALFVLSLATRRQRSLSFPLVFVFLPAYVTEAELDRLLTPDVWEEPTSLVAKEQIVLAGSLRPCLC